MDAFAKSEIFFFVTTIAIVCISIVLFIAIVYLIRILRDVRFLSQKAKEEGGELIKDVGEFRTKVKKEGLRLVDMTGILKRFFTRKRKKSN